MMIAVAVLVCTLHAQTLNTTSASTSVLNNTVLVQPTFDQWAQQYGVTYATDV
jgi:hypothetical protein